MDGIRPTIWRVYLSGGFGKPYTVGTEIRVRVEFTESARISGRPQLALDFDGTPKTSEWAGGWRGSFSYAIQEGDRDSDGVAIGANAISLNGGTVRDGAGNDAVLTHGAVAAVSYIKVDAVAPTVSSIAITSDPREDDTYDTGDQIEVTVTFSELVEVWNVTRGDPPGSDRWPQLELDIGGEARTAEYQSFTGAEVVFEYTVQDGDTDENGIALGANKLALNGGAIFDYAENHPIGAGIDFWDVPLDAVVSHDAVSDDAGHKVAGSSSSLTLSGDTTLRFWENSSRYVAGYRVSGTDDSLTWSLSGDDSDDFKISSGGTVNWVSSPNYEDPTDADKDNRYRVTIQASDGKNEAKLQVTVVVTNIPVDSDEVPTVTGTVQVGETLTADTSLISFYRYGMGPWYFWLRSDGTTDTEIEGARSSSYTPVPADEGYAIKVRVNFYTYEFVSLTSEPTAVVAANPNSPANSPATGAPTISGTAYVGNTLTADTSGISDADGLTNRTFSYQWIRNDGTRDAEISGATGATYTLVEADEGKNIKVRASFTDDASNTETLTSAPTATVAVRATPLTGLTVNPGTLAPAFHIYTFNYAVPDLANSDSRITVNITVKDGYEYEIAPDEGENTYVVGSTDPWSLSEWNISYSPSGNPFKPLPDADTDSPGFQIDLDGGENQFQIRVYRPGYFGEFVELTITRAPGPPDAPHLNVSPHDNGALAVSWEAPASDGGSEITGYRVQWKEAAGSWDTPADVSETTVTGTTHTITGLTDGVHYTVRVIAVNDLGDSGPSEEATGTPRETDPPGLSTATVDGVTLTLTYDEALDEGSLAEAGAFAVTVGGAARAVDSVSIAGNGVKLTLASAVAAGEEVTVSYTAPADESTARIRDLAGNAAPSFSGQAAANDTQAPATLTASIHDEPDRHDGETAFTFELKFSEEPHPDFSYVTLRDHAFTVTGGSLSGVRRLAPPGNVRWEITITPSSDEAVKVALPPTTDCEAQGAICTEDGRMLSEKAELTVEGPVEENTPATGAPTISGTVRVGETLTADTSGIADEDGLDNAVFSYQWLADGVEIADATGSTYTLVSADEGKTVKVRVSFTDDADNEETLTSTATESVAAVAEADDGDGPSLRSYITVVVADDQSDPDNVGTSLGITWSDVDECSSDYNAYISNSPEDGKTHLGSAASDGAQITSSLTDITRHFIFFHVELYCGTEESGRLVSRVDIPHIGGRLFPDTYSSEPPLTGLTVNHGTLTPAFHSHTFGYTVPDVSNSDRRITVNATAKDGYEYEIAPDEGENTYVVGSTDPWSLSEWTISYSPSGNPFKPLTDADADSPGFQIDLDGGENQFQIRVYRPGYFGEFVELTITRAPGPPDAPHLNVSPHDNGALAVSWEAPASDGGSEITGYRVQWKEAAGSWDTPADVSETTVTGTTHTITGLTDGVQYIVRVIAVNDLGDSDPSEEATGTPGDTSAPDPAQNTPATGAPTITGTARVGETLTADTSGIADADGLDNATFRYQWISSDGTTDADIEDATDSTYTLASADEGKTVKVRVSFTDDAGNEETLTSAATDEVAPGPNSPATGLPTISGTAQVDQTLTADTSGIADEDGLDNASFSYQWVAGGSDILGAIGSSYTLTSSEQGQTIQVRVSFTDDAGNAEKLTSAATAAVTARPNTPATGQPTISGIAQVDETLTVDVSGIADADGMTNATFTYQWIAVDADIEGETGSTYEVSEGDVGKTIQVRVSFTDDADNEESLTSAATAAVAPAPPPLTVSLTAPAPATHDGSATFTFEIEFSEEFSLSYKTLKFHAFNVTGGTILKSQRTDKPSNIPWRITVRPDSNGDVEIELPATTDCGATGAICTEDGRKLSNALNFTVSGPGQ